MGGNGMGFLEAKTNIKLNFFYDNAKSTQGI